MTSKPTPKPGKQPDANPTETPAQPHLFSTRARILIGQSRRKQLKRLAHATWNPKDRRVSPQDLLKASTRGRLPSLVTLKNERMACSPFAYFRGAAPVMAYDLSLLPNTGIINQICGDAHVRNLGAFAGPDGRLVFDINDFDETTLGPFEWDIKRLATSLILAGREAGAGNSRCREAADTFLAQYRDMIHLFSRMPVLAVARYQVHRLGEVGPISVILSAAERSTPLHTLTTLTEPTPPAKSPRPGAPRNTPRNTPKSRIFKTAKPVLWRITGPEAERVLASLTPYADSLLPERRRLLSHYRALDVAFKVVGTGSVGLRDYCIYLEGNGRKDPLFLQIKEAVQSAYAPYRSEPALANQHQGRRVVEGERSMQIQSDPFLGWTTVLDADSTPRQFLVRQLNDHKGSLDLTQLKPNGLMEYARVCGEMLARGHARAGDCALLAGYIGTSKRFDEAIARFAETYADQTEKDWQHHVKSLKK